jgi:hypothetical protein
MKKECVALALCLLLTGCGSGAESTTVASSSPPAAAQSATGAVSYPARPTAPPDFQDEALAQKQPLRYAWNLFLWGAWPASSRRGVPDAQASLDVDATTTWETFKQSFTEVYLEDGSPPPPWDAPPPPVGKTAVPSKVLKAADPALFTATLPFSGGVHLTDANGNRILEEVRMNRALFESVVKQGLYSSDGQCAAYKSGLESIQFPPTAPGEAPSMEIKATWTVIRPDETALLSRYHTATAWTQVGENPDGSPIYQRETVGLTGLHMSIRFNSMPNWFWTTFEHVDNPVRTPRAFSYPQNDDPPEVVAINEKMQRALKGTVWANYRVRGAQPGAFLNPDGSPSILGNTQLETAFQTSASCITCHHISTLGPPGPDGRMTFIPFEDHPNGPDGLPVGHVGLLPESFFVGYKQGDFVWSLLEANPRQQ